NIIEKHPEIDLILMDIGLPNMNGLEVVEKIRQFNNKVIIIAQTAYGFLSDKENALKSGCNDYISKPIKKDNIIALINKYF
ncbi:MAG: response regulator, partial [Bacteroidales bacterium]|nr:response regulator [Bacteroidales bacterium]